ncbi:hypothetical protein [Streptomyces cacaoi]
MRSMRSTLLGKGAVAAIATACMLLPVAPAAASADRAPQRGPSADGRAAPRLDGTAARQAAVCKDARQIGSTGYIKRSGSTIGSVKLYHSKRCNLYYGYLWVWQSFRNQHPVYDTNVGVSVRGHLQGARTFHNTKAQEFWSDGVRASGCVSARGAIRAPKDTKWSYAYSGRAC